MAQKPRQQTTNSSGSGLPPASYGQGSIGTGNPDLDAAKQALLNGTASAGTGANSATLWGMSGWGDATVNEKGVVPASTRMTRAGQVGGRSTGWGPRSTTTPAHPGIVQTRATDMMNRILQFTPQQLADLQFKMFQGGLYPKSMKPEDMAIGMRDPATLEAWQNLILMSAQYAAGGSNMTLDEVLDSLVQTGAGLKALAANSGGGGGGGGGQPTILSDPAEIRAMSDQIGQQLLGRNLTDKEKESLVQAIHGSEAGYYAQARGGASTITQVNPQAQAMEFIKSNMAPEYAATQVASTYDMFRQIIGGSRG